MTASSHRAARRTADVRRAVDALCASRAQTALITTFTPEGRDLRSLLSGMIATQPALNHALAERLTALAVTYPTADPTAHPLNGTAAPAAHTGGPVERGRGVGPGGVAHERPGHGRSPCGGLISALSLWGMAVWTVTGAASVSRQAA
ncbi:hypothetical protein OHA71_25290 [Streptomyces sp. NBC_00444]|uniref:hypothetical protein n=1 Tax=Streptomyces sp. NBC_00444 TaxID=2975744 RepID=UPI002E1F240D